MEVFVFLERDGDSVSTVQNGVIKISGPNSNAVTVTREKKGSLVTAPL